MKDMNKQHLLNLAEYILLSGLVAGSILAIASGQVAYAYLVQAENSTAGSVKRRIRCTS